MLVKKTLLSVFAVAVLMGGFYASTVSADESGDIIKYRKNVMKSLAADSRMIKAVLSGKISRNQDLLAAASSLAAKSKMVKDNFPEDSDFGDTDAKEAIWENKADFEQKSDTLVNAAGALYEALQKGAKADEIGNKYAAVGKSCKGCHKKYREK